MLDVRNIAFTYRAKPVLRDVSFVVSPGEAVCVVGANGAGKTTLLRVLATLAAADSGKVLMDGRDALAQPLKYRRQLGYLSETAPLYDDLTVRGFLRYRAQLKGEPDKRIRRRIDEAVELCRLGAHLRAPLRSLSFGLRKRVALADAVLLRPRVLLLDDFLSGLDREMRDIAGEALSTAASFSCAIVTGHDIADLARWATRFLVLRDGVIAATVPTAGVEHRVLVDRVAAAVRGGAPS